MSIVEHPIRELEKTLELTERIPEITYRERGDKQGSIGAHVRHVLDFVNALLQGIRTGSVDYTARERDERTERDRRYAAWKIRIAIRDLGKCSREDPGMLLSVRSEVLPGTWHRSSFSREVEFVFTHMVHHHALISERLNGLDHTVPTGLGISPSTSEYIDRMKIAA